MLDENKINSYNEFIWDKNSNKYGLNIISFLLMLHNLFLILKLRLECINVPSKSNINGYSLLSFISGNKYLFSFELSIIL